METQQKQTLGKLETKIIKIVSEVMEMSFIDASHLDTRSVFEDIDWLNTSSLSAEILILHPFPGELRLVMPTNLVTKMANNLYAMENPSEEILNDLIGETINMMAGRLIATIIPTNKKFKLGLPELGQESFLDTDAFTFAVDFDGEGLPFWLVVCGEGFLEYSLE